MAIRTYLQSLGATHLFDLDNNGTLTTDDLGSSSTPTNISGGTYTFDTDPVCEGVTHSLDVVANTSAGTYGAVFTNVSGINTGITGWNTDKRSLLIWCKQSDIENPTCIYEQGGGINNFAFMGGALATFQAAYAGQPFLIVQSKSLTQINRPYCFVGVWEYHTQHAGSGNRVLFYINGVLQGISELTGTDPFPSHGGNIACGNSGDNLQSFAGTALTSQTTDKNCNFLGMFNNVSLTQVQCREIFERATIADVLIPADTVANQQAALDVLSGNTYENTNCAIRIIQASDATNYRLFVDNITFNADPNLEDISIQFVGTGTLTLEDTNGTVIKYTSTPPEVETTSTTYTGGGSIVVVNNTKRVTTDQTITNPQDDKIVFDGSGSTYTIDGGIVPVIENVSGNTVTVSLINGAPTPTLLETDGSFIVVDAGIINVADGTTYTVDAEKKFVVDTDTVTSFTISGIIPKEIETTGTGSTTIIGINNAKLTTTTISGTGTLVLGDGLNPSSNWSYNSGTSTLELVGTESDLLGLRGLEQVDYAVAGGKIVYTFTDTTKLRITGSGDLTIDSDIEQMVLGVQPANGTNTLVVSNGGRLQVGLAKVVGGFTIYSGGPAIVFSNDSSNASFTVSHDWANLLVQNGGRLDWYGGEIQTVGEIGTLAGSIIRTYSKEAMFVSVPSSLQSSRPEAYLRQDTDNIQVDGFTNKFGIYLSIGKPALFKGYEPISSGSAIDMSNQSTRSSYYDYEDLVAGKGNIRDVGGKSETWVRLLNTNNGSDITVTAQNTVGGTDQKYLVESKKSVLFQYTDENESIIQGAKVYLADTDHGSRLGANLVGTNSEYTSDKVYTGISDGSGEIDFTSVTDAILLSVHYSTNNIAGAEFNIIDYRGNDNDSTDLFTFYSISYLHGIASSTPELKGIGTLGLDQVLITDSLITETNKATVDAYVELETSAKVYDRAKSYLYDNYLGESSVIVNREGTVINAFNLDVDLDTAAVSVLDLTGSTLTIKTSGYTEGLKTTGVITTDVIAEGADLEASSITLSTTSIATQATIRNSTSGLIITQPGTYNFKEWTFDSNTVDITVADNTGAVTIQTGGASLNINQGANNTITLDATVTWTFNVSPAGGTFTMLDTDKWNNFLGVYVSDAAAQADNLTPASGDYYAVDADSNDVRESHGYWDGAQWVLHASDIIAENEILASDLGGPGASSQFTVELLPGSNWKWFYDTINYTPKLNTITVSGAGSTTVELGYNPSFNGIDQAVYTDVATNYLPLASLRPANSSGTMTGEIPSLPEGDIDYALVFVELMRLTLDSGRGALVTGDPLLLEVIDRRVIVKNDTFKVVPLTSYPAGTKVFFGAYVQFENFTIEFAPVDANGNYVAYTATPYNLVNGATMAGTVDSNIVKVDGIDQSSYKIASRKDIIPPVI